MTGNEAWKIISENLYELKRRRAAMNQDPHPWTDEEITAEVVAFNALRKMDEMEECNLWTSRSDCTTGSASH